MARPSRLLIILFAAAIGAALQGCAPREVLFSGSSFQSGAFAEAAYAESSRSGIRVATHDRSELRFLDDAWSLTLDGIRGTAVVQPSDGPAFQRDTTLSYWDVASASPAGGRGSSMTQFLLTILGVILIIGLAALIFYAAFPATDK